MLLKSVIPSSCYSKAKFCFNNSVLNNLNLKTFLSKAIDKNIYLNNKCRSNIICNNYKRLFSNYTTKKLEDEENPMLKLRNIGISAHIDSGKTTFTERVLFYTGRIDSIHEVKGTDKVGAKMDSMELERERGITIQSAATYCAWKDNHINIIDTPGHVDFTIEVERALRVLDGAVLLICGASGVQPQTLTVNKQMNRYDVPRLVFINKLDRAGANPDSAINQLITRLKLNAAAVQIPIGIESELKGIIDIIQMKAVYFEGPNGEEIVYDDKIPDRYIDKANEIRKILIEKVAEVDSELEELFITAEDINKDIKVEDIKKAIRRCVINRTFVPVFMGSAIKNKGVQLCLDGVIDYLPNPVEKPQKAFVHKSLVVKNVGAIIKQENIVEEEDQEKPEEIELTNDISKPFIGMAFKLQENKYGQLTFMRAYQGQLKRGDILTNMAINKKIKISRLVRMHSDEMEEIQDVQCGEIFAIFGIECASGDTFSADERKITLEKMHVPESVMSLSIKPKKTEFIPKFLKAVARFQREDPTFRVYQNEETEEMIMSGMGELHLQVYAERIRREYEIDVDVGNPQVNYRESITQIGNFNYLHKKQSGGAGQFARVVGYVQPLIEDFSNTSDKSNMFEDKTGGQNIPHEYVVAVEKAFHECCKKGPLTGSPVIGMKYVLEDGQTHPVDSSGLAFSIATKYSVTQAFEDAEATLLEPVMNVEVSGPTESQNAMINSISKRKGNIFDMNTQGDISVINCEVTLSNMFGYATELRSLTQGVGEFSMEYKFHAPVNSMDLDMILEKRRKENEASKSDNKKKGGFSK